MLKIFDKNHNAMGHIVKYRDCKIESELSTGDKTLSFTYLAKHHNLENEMYVQTKDDEFVIKEVPGATGSFPQIVAILNLEELQKDMWDKFSVTDATIDEAARPLLAGTGWRISECDVTKRRNAGMIQVSTLDAIQKLCIVFMCEPVFDTINKTVSFYAKRGEDRGVYFMSGLNLKKLQKKSISYDYYTRLIPIGANGLSIESVNNGNNYLENHQYSDKVLTCIWKDESYTDPQALKEDGELKLNDLSKPEVSYSAEVRDLARQKSEYSILSFGLGDTVALIDRETNTKEKQRIVRMVEYPQNPEKNTCEIANTVLTFEEMQQKMQEAAEIVNYTITGDGRYTGTISVSDILNFEQGIAGSTTIGGINGSISTMQGEVAELKGKYGSLEVNFLTAEEAELKYAKIENLNVTNQTVHSIQGDYASFKTMVTEEFSAQTGIIDNLSGDLATFKTSISNEMITAKGWMLEGSIGDAQISSVSANKLTAGTIDAAIVTIAGTDGRLQIVDNTIQIKDANRVRVQIGKDASGDYTLAVWDSAGKLIWDALGATEDTIQRAIIRDKMVADDAAIQALKLDLQSFNTAMTQQGVTISGTIVQVGNKTLNIALTEQTQLLTEQGETLTDHAARITANEDSIKLKVSTQEYSTFRTSVNSELASAKSRLSATESSITAMQGQIALKVEQTDIEEAIEEVNDKFSSYSTTAQMQSAIAAAKDSITQSVSSTYATKTQVNTVSGNVTTLTSRVSAAESKLTKDSLVTTIGSYYASGSDLASAENRLTTVETKATQTATEIGWLIKSGTSSTNFTLTDRTATLIANAINLSGLVTFSGLDSAAQNKISTAQSAATNAQTIANTANARATYHYGTCTTAANVTEKTVALSGFLLYVGATVSIRFQYGNTATSPTLNINNTGAKSIVIAGKVSTREWKTTYAVMTFVYDGEFWRLTSDEAYMIADAAQISAEAADAVITSWCYNNNKTYINGGKIYARSITSTQLATDAIKSLNYSYSSGNYSEAGTFLDLSNGIIRSKKFGIDANGNAYFAGSLSGATGSFTGNVNALYITASQGYEIYCSGNSDESFPIIGMYSWEEGEKTLYFGYNSIKILVGESLNAENEKEEHIRLIAGEVKIEANSFTVDYTSSFHGASLFSDVVNFFGNTIFSEMATFNGSTTVNGDFEFKDYIGSVRKPIASITTQTQRISHMGSQLTNGTYLINVSGTWGGTTYSAKKINTTTSDIRLKENIVPTQVKALSVINKMQLYQFDWKEGHYHQDIGFVADYLEAIDKSFAIGGGYDADGCMDVKSVNEFLVTAYAIKGIQELCDWMVRMENAGSSLVSWAAAADDRIESLDKKYRSQILSLESQVFSQQYQIQQLFAENAALKKKLQAVG